MNFTKAKIFNLALKNLRISASIQNTSQQDKNTSVLNEYYDIAKEQVLKDFDWNFASAYRQLSPTGNIPLNLFYKYEYDYPNDCLLAREIVTSSDCFIDFEICMNNNQKVICTQITPAILRYTKSVNSESQFTTEFASALSWYLAFLSAPAITSDRNIQNDTFIIYKNLLKRAKLLNATEGYLSSPNSCDWIDVR